MGMGLRRGERAERRAERETMIYTGRTLGREGRSMRAMNLSESARRLQSRSCLGRRHRIIIITSKSGKAVRDTRILI